MTMTNATWVALALGLALGLPVAGTGQLTPDQVARLDGDLTPVGAERAGNADGTIPAWTGGLAQTPPIDPKIGYVDPFAGDTPLYTITPKNADQYKNLLSAGHLALLKRDARTFKMNVYPTHRSAALPDDVLAEIRKQAPLARTDGDQVLDIGKSAVPFPIPANGLQVMWNHVFRWRGGSFERQFVWAPVDASGKFYIVKYHEEGVFDQHGYMQESRPEWLYHQTGFFLSPPVAVGQRVATWEPVNPAVDARARWVFVPQNFDTRRYPSYDHDTIEPLTNGLRTADQADGWNGSPERYDWKLVGKRELLIGYNAYKLADRTLRYPDILRTRNVDPELLRYELHRVWVVEATLRKGHYHSFARRVFYVDEDTWQVAQEEVYNKEGKLVRFGDHQMMQFYDVMVPWYAATIHHDIATGSYLVTYLSNMELFPTRWGFKGRLADFLPNNLSILGQQ
jgi:hypothetical protein